MKAEVVFVNFHFIELGSCYILLSLANLFGTFKVFSDHRFPISYFVCCPVDYFPNQYQSK